MTAALNGNEVFFASFPKTLLVDVTQEDIDNGTPGDNWDCPQQRAFHRAIEALGISDQATSVGVATALVWENYETSPLIIAQYRTSGTAQEFIRKYDRNQASVKPARFRYTLVTPKFRSHSQ